jgi:peptidoglycan L-alanyl-D-glutamate endopeptidase CwlK
MDAQSEAVLALVNPALANLVRAAQDTLTPQNIFMSVYQGLRTAEEQNALYAQGRTAPGQIVTNAKAGCSNHNYGLAVDIVPFHSGAGGPLNWNISSPPFQAMVAALKAQGLVYGGDWKTFPDNDHFQLPNMPASPSPAMIADFNKGVPTSQFWACYDAGNYIPPGAKPGAPESGGAVDA